MNIKLQHLVASQYEAAGFKKIADDIQGAKNAGGVRKVVINVIKQCIKSDPSGFGNELRNLCVKGESNNG